MSISAPVPPIVDHNIVSISLDLGVTTPDALRGIEFGLEKGTGDDNSAGRMIHFAFQTRVSSSDAVTDEVTLKIAVKTRDPDKEQATETEGLSDAQVTALCQQHSARHGNDAGLMQVAGRRF
jgi:hypothetical protein